MFDRNQYRFIDNTADRPTGICITPDGWDDGRACIELDGDDIAFLPASERQRAAQALAGDEWQIVPKAGATPPLYLLDDLWQALGGDPADFDDWHTRHGTADTWGQLLAIVRRTFRPVCGKPVDGEHCVLTKPLHPDDMHVCHGPSDVGIDELPPIPAAQPDRPAPVDPSEVRVGDVVEVEADDGSWMVRGRVGSVGNQQIRIDYSDKHWTWIHPATVRILRRAEPEPDPELLRIVRDVNLATWDSSEEYVRELERRGVRLVDDRGPDA